MPRREWNRVLGLSYNGVLCTDDIKGFHREGGPVEHVVHMRYPREEVCIEYNIELYYSLERRSK